MAKCFDKKSTIWWNKQSSLKHNKSYVTKIETKFKYNQIKVKKILTTGFAMYIIIV